MNRRRRSVSLGRVTCRHEARARRKKDAQERAARPLIHTPAPSLIAENRPRRALAAQGVLVGLGVRLAATVGGCVGAVVPVKGAGVKSGSGIGVALVTTAGVAAGVAVLIGVRVKASVTVGVGVARRVTVTLGVKVSAALT